MIEVSFLPCDSAIDPLLGFAVIAARHEDSWIFCRHRERTTWELPGGHREPGEDILTTARRELYEETGAAESELFPVCIYRVQGEREGYGMLDYAEITALGPLPPTEIEEIIHAPAMPEETTYPLIQPLLFLQANRWLEEQRR